MVYKPKESIYQTPFPWISREDIRDGTKNERQGSIPSSRQSERLPSGPVADIGKDFLLRFIETKEFSEDEVNLLFK
ncbi:MAG: hypothetical protein EZS28_009863 [Streblomastix strix]|uniref:Uncharacterized protein n=1 Tax=Streblomastix strix TaxID=222440 RepID=A0A5J4WIR2_9EUKA|nr:MAG: hypothetical protein EZS28_009863 [Streblomastix strix]